MPAQKVEIYVRSPRRELSPLQRVTSLLISWCKCLQELPPGRLETSKTVKYERPKSGRTISVDSDGLGRARIFLDCALFRCDLYALQHSLLGLFPGSSFSALRLLSPALRRSYHGPSVTASHKDIVPSTTASVEALAARIVQEQWQEARESHQPHHLTASSKCVLRQLCLQRMESYNSAL